MKVVLFSLLGLMCLQVSLVASAHISQTEPDNRTLDSEEENKTELGSICDRSDVFQPEQRLTVVPCIMALKSLGSVTWEGYNIYTEKKQNEKKATEGKAKCQETTNNAEDLQKCLKTVQEEFKKVNKELDEKIFELSPKVASALLALLGCMLSL